MKKDTFKRIGAAVLAGVLLTASAAGCSAREGDSSSSKAGDNSTASKPKLRVATNAEFEPWESIDSATKEYIGFDMDLIREIAKKLDMDVEIQNMEFDSVVASLPTGACDVAISGLTITPGRSKTVDFSESYHETAQILMVRTNDTVFTGTTKEALDEQLKGKKIGVCTAFTGESYAKGKEDLGYPGIEGADVKSYDNVSLAAQELKNGTIDVIIMDEAVAKNAAAADQNKDAIKVIDVPLTVEYYAIAMKKGNAELKEKINKALKELQDSGKVDELKKTWGIGE